jgi:hypothetical protein
MIALAALLAFIVAAGGPAPARRSRGPAIARHLVAAAFDADRAWRYAMLAPVRLHEEMERVRADVERARIDAEIKAVHRKLFAPPRRSTTIVDFPPLREWAGVAA